MTEVPETTGNATDRGPSESAVEGRNHAIAGDHGPVSGHDSGHAATEVPYTAGDAVETALAAALTGAVAAGRFDVVAQIASELAARRAARTGVVDLDAARRAREGR